jgi:ubiquinol-cytochrome c reductase cytochrome b subunit
VSVRRRLGAWLDTRVGHRAALADLRAARLPGGASMMYVFGWALTFLLGLQLVTGVLLALVYSPSVSAAWASVAYLEDQTTWGWLVRGVHHYGASAVVITTGLHLMQTAVYGAYKKPREVNWLLGRAAGTGDGLRAHGLPAAVGRDGYAATQIATGIAGSTPLVGEPRTQALQGGNDLGNLTLTRLFTIHALLLPLLTVLALVLHIRLYKKHGPTPRWDRLPDALAKLATPAWPHQTVRARDRVRGGVRGDRDDHGGHGRRRLDEPADPAAAFDARPAWYFRPLFQALKYVSGSAEVVVALGVPALVGGYLLLLPRLDRSPARAATTPAAARRARRVRARGRDAARAVVPRRRGRRRARQAPRPVRAAGRDRAPAGANLRRPRSRRPGGLHHGALLPRPRGVAGPSARAATSATSARRRSSSRGSPGAPTCAA